MRIPLSHYFYSVFILSFIRLSGSLPPSSHLPPSFSHIHRSHVLAIPPEPLRLLRPSASCRSHPLPLHPSSLSPAGFDWQLRKRRKRKRGRKRRKGGRKKRKRKRGRKRGRKRRRRRRKRGRKRGRRGREGGIVRGRRGREGVRGGKVSGRGRARKRKRGWKRKRGRRGREGGIVR